MFESHLEASHISCFVYEYIHGTKLKQYSLYKSLICFGALIDYKEYIEVNILIRAAYVSCEN